MIVSADPEQIEPVAVLREEDGHMPSLLFADAALAASPDAAMDVACGWLAANGVDERGIFTARNEGAPAHERVQLAYWGGFDRGFVQVHHDGAVPVTVVFLPRGAIPMPADPTIAGHQVTPGGGPE